MKKRSLIALIALIVACMMVFAACGGGADKEDEKKDDETTVSTEDTTAAPEVDDTTAAPEVETPATNEALSEVAYAGYTSYDTIEGFTFYYDSSNTVKKISFEEVAFPGNVTEDASKVIEALYTKINGYIAQGYDVVATKSNATDDVYYAEAVITLSSQKEIALFYEILGSTSSATELTLADAESFVKSKGYTLFNPDTMDITDLVPSGSEEPSNPAASAGSVVYQMTDEEEGVIAYNFIYDANGNVTEVDYAMVTTPEKTESQEVIEVFDQVYGAFEQLKNAGCDVTVEYGVVDGVRALEAKIMVSGEMEVSFISSILEANFTGATIKLADAEAAAKAQGYTLFEG